MNRPLGMGGISALLLALVAVSVYAAPPTPAGSSASAWTRATPKPDTALTDPVVRRGKALFDGHCRTCHAPAAAAADRGFYPGTYALDQRYQGKLPAALEERKDLTAARVTYVVRHGGGGFMPPLRPTELSDDELKAVAAYLARLNPHAQ